MTAPTTPRSRFRLAPAAWAWLAGLLALAAYLSTLQWGINGSSSPYATDVGEIQNALPRWGTLHFTGYPLYTVLGSAFVTALRGLGLEPSAGASLYSALWGALTVGWLAWFLLDLGVSPPLAALAALLTGLTTSFWVDSTIAEVHTLTMFWTVAALHLGWRFGRSGARSDWLWFVFAATQGVAHQRAVAFVAPALLALVIARQREMLRWFWPALGVALLAPLTYAYLPLRAWMGADWTFNAPGTWGGFWSMIGDTKSGRILAIPSGAGEWVQRARLTVGLLADDLPLWALIPGLVGLLAPLRQKRWGLGLALLLLAGAYTLLCLVIWEGRVSDALLAVKLPVMVAASTGLALGLTALAGSSHWRGVVAAVLLGTLTVFLLLTVRPTVLAITRDPAAEATISTVEAIPRGDGPPITMMALWGHDYWALTYAQRFRGQLAGLETVDHNAPFDRLLAESQRLMTLERTFYERPVAWWEAQIGGRVYLSSAAPGVVEIAVRPALAAEPAPAPLLDLGNGAQIASATLAWDGPQRLILSVTWRAAAPLTHDYSVAVHLLAQNPPTGPQDILSQADRQHPVYGWYPTTRWVAGEVVADHYVISMPAGASPVQAGASPVQAGASPVGVRLGMYRANDQGGFENSPWLFLPLP